MKDYINIKYINMNQFKKTFVKIEYFVLSG